MKKAIEIVESILILSLGLLLIPGACHLESESERSFQAAWSNWHEQRLEQLKSPQGWLSLAGLFWLQPGEQTMGGSRDNDFIIRHAPVSARIGTFLLRDGTVTFTAFSGVTVTSHGFEIKSIAMIDDRSGSPTILSHSTLRWHIIRRGKRFGVRLKDTRHPRINRLKKIPVFVPDPSWRIQALFKPFPTPRKIPVPNVLGNIEMQPCPGEIIFFRNSRQFRLLPVGDENALFIVFGDLTNGLDTYGGGRFMGLAAPDKNGRIILDFNRAYNPPCAFSPHATCPLPPTENELPIRIEAGEKKVPGFAHH